MNPRLTRRLPVQVRLLTNGSTDADRSRRPASDFEADHEGGAGRGAHERVRRRQGSASLRPGARTQAAAAQPAAPIAPARLVLLTAPAGYSKTTCLAEWAAAEKRPFVWLTAHPRHDDPALLVASIVELLEEIEPVEADVLAALATPDPSISTVVLPRLGRSLRGRRAIRAGHRRRSRGHLPKGARGARDSDRASPRWSAARACRSNRAAAAARADARPPAARRAESGGPLDDAGGERRAAGQDRHRAELRSARSALRAHRRMAGRALPRRPCPRRPAGHQRGRRLFRRR